MLLMTHGQERRLQGIFEQSAAKFDHVAALGLLENIVEIVELHKGNDHELVDAIVKTIEHVQSRNYTREFLPKVQKYWLDQVSNFK